MSLTYQRFGKHLIDCCCGQSLVALSSGEAEFYAMVKTAAEGKLTHAILEHFGWRTKHAVLSDSSAARSLAQRVGCGKVKHLSLKEMWIQQAVRDKELSINWQGGHINESCRSWHEGSRGKQARVLSEAAALGRRGAWRQLC